MDSLARTYFALDPVVLVGLEDSFCVGCKLFARPGSFMRYASGLIGYKQALEVLWPTIVGYCVKQYLDLTLYALQLGPKIVQMQDFPSILDFSFS